MNSNQKPLIIGLVVVIVLLAAIVGVLIYSGNKADSTKTTTSTTATDAAATSASSAMQQSLSKAADFDEKTSTKLDKDTTPAEWVEAYYKACDEKDWETAWKHLPAVKRDVTTAEELGQQLESYGITGYKVDGTKKNSDGETEITVTQNTSYGDFTTVWTFMPKDGTFLLKDKAVAGMSQ